MSLLIALSCVAALLGTSCLGAAIAPRRDASAVVYGLTLGI